MYCVRLFGGVGNNLFQLAFAVFLMREFPGPVWLDVCDLTEGQKRTLEALVDLERLGFDTGKSRWHRFRSAGIFHGGRLRQKELRLMEYLGRAYGERDFGFIPYLDGPVSRGVRYFSGYFQSGRLAFQESAHIRGALKIPSEAASRERSQPKIRIHVRRGDYLLPRARDLHGVLGADYYRAALAEILGREPLSSTIEFVSDDPAWCRTELAASLGLEHGDVGSGTGGPASPHEDFCRLADSEYLIIANSTFGYWSALSGNPRIVVAPKAWFADEEMNARANQLIPANWLRV